MWENLPEATERVRKKSWRQPNMLEKRGRQLNVLEKKGGN
jgi:hypothetical protein